MTEEESKLPLGTDDGADDHEESEEQDTPTNEDYKRKFEASTREEQKRREQLAAMERTLGELTKEGKPTESELRTAYPNWDYYSEEMKETKAELLEAKRLASRGLTVAQGLMAKEQLTPQLQALAEKYPEFEDKDRLDDFRKFVTKPNNQGASLETLAQAYLYANGSKKFIKKQVEGLEPSGRGSHVTRSSGGSGKKSTLSPQALQFAKLAGITEEDLKKRQS